MTDDRIARLTDLARQAWPPGPHDTDLTIDEMPDFQSAAVRVNGEALLLVEDHPKALDAIEAALYVLIGKDEPLSTSQAKDVYSEAFAVAKRLFSREPLYRIDPDGTIECMEPPPWVEELAGKWEAEAKRRSWLNEESHARSEHLHAAYCAGSSAGHAWCAAELRERAKGTDDK